MNEVYCIIRKHKVRKCQKSACFNPISVSAMEVCGMSKVNISNLELCEDNFKSHYK